MLLSRAQPQGLGCSRLIGRATSCHASRPLVAAGLRGTAEVVRGAAKGAEEHLTLEIQRANARVGQASLRAQLEAAKAAAA